MPNTISEYQLRENPVSMKPEEWPRSWKKGYRNSLKLDYHPR